MKHVHHMVPTEVLYDTTDAGMTKEARPSQVTRSDSKSRNGAQPTQDAIGRRLREYYDDVVNEPVPDDFMNLLAKLDGPEEEDGNDAR